MILQVYWNGGEFVHAMLGTYDLALILVGLVFVLAGEIASALVKIVYSGAITNNPLTPNKFSFLFMLKDNFAKFLLALVVALVVMRIFAPSFTNATLLITFSFGVGAAGYRLALPLIAYTQKLNPLLRNFSFRASNKQAPINNDEAKSSE